MPSWILRLYPRAWRARYGAEVRTMLAGERLTARLVLDLVAGAIDARLSPQSITGGQAMRARLLCGPVALTREDRIKSNIILLGGSAVFALACIWIRFAYPAERMLAQGLATIGFPIALVVSGYWTYLKPYRPAVRLRMMAIEVVVVTGIIVSAMIIAARINP